MSHSSRISAVRPSWLAWAARGSTPTRVRKPLGWAASGRMVWYSSSLRQPGKAWKKKVPRSSTCARASARKVLPAPAGPVRKAPEEGRARRAACTWASSSSVRR